MGSRGLGLLLAGLGVAAVVVGLVIASGVLSWFGRLPGDIHIRGEHSQLYIPLASMIVVSVALTLLLNVIRRFF